MSLPNNEAIPSGLVVFLNTLSIGCHTDDLVFLKPILCGLGKRIGKQNNSLERNEKFGESIKRTRPGMGMPGVE
jgi:hypothetical protein